jgi:hypothetical protein
VSSTASESSRLSVGIMPEDAEAGAERGCCENSYNNYMIRKQSAIVWMIRNKFRFYIYLCIVSVLVYPPLLALYMAVIIAFFMWYPELLLWWMSIRRPRAGLPCFGGGAAAAA